ncbi:MAG: thymidine phosphorylase [Paracoccus sp. (in: a-proteobacteria)]|uniref:thymidine phosphorylase n=1 Tax=Paracoccus sp. TaxID=267 RepID=UPI0026DFE848|nr:thymidine phosphorylase [Paracoccus sp. (in: a-proteobacteria)]MDO5620533.1 thymidine phosphorylase [Paracoccus sp. (in: a-proteobacteria)]
MSNARRIIARLRDGQGLTVQDAQWFARGLATGEVGDAQAGAFAMAVYLRGLDGAGRAALTHAMRDSGEVLRWDLPGPVVDKHSTGGVGDSVSLILAPALAACGCYVPMISGRGLGHTGGTLDKLEAIPGYRTQVDRATLNRVLDRAGCAIVGASDDLAPADRRLYAIRDISGTVESLDLIVSSILSKKLAAGSDALVLDVKCGNGAFMRDLDSARALAHALVETANDAGCQSVALITDMNSPLAGSVGNAVEVADAIEALTRPLVPGYRGPRDLAIILGGELLALTGLAPDPQAGAERVRAVIKSGHAAERFAKMVAELGGPTDLIERPREYLPKDGRSFWDESDWRSGDHYVQSIDTRAIGELILRLGGGRVRPGDPIHHGVGIYHIAQIGESVTDHGESVGHIHARTSEEAEAAYPELQAAFTLGPDPMVKPPPLILDRITAE